MKKTSCHLANRIVSQGLLGLASYLFNILMSISSQANAKLARRSLELFEELLGSIDPRLEWRRHEAFVPSFHEVYPSQLICEIFNLGFKLI